MKANKFGVQVKGLTEGSREKLAEALATFVSVDNAKALVTVGKLGQHKAIREVVILKFSEEYQDAMVMEGDEVLTLRPEER